MDFGWSAYPVRMPSLPSPDRIVARVGDEDLLAAVVRSVSFCDLLRTKLFCSFNLSYLNGTGQRRTKSNSIQLVLVFSLTKPGPGLSQPAERPIGTLWLERQRGRHSYISGSVLVPNASFRADRTLRTGHKVTLEWKA